MGHAPDWMRQSYGKVKKMADGGSAGLPDIETETPDDTTVSPYAFKDLRGVDNIGANVTRNLGGGNKVMVDGSIGGYRSSDQYGDKVSETNTWHRLGYAKELEGDRELGAGVSGYSYRGERGGESFKGGETAATGDVRYRDGNNEFGASYTPEGKRVQVTFRKRF